MAKVNPYQIDHKEKYVAIDGMFEVISKLKTKKEIVDFLLGLFTPSESLMLARRIQIAKMILEGENYENIRKKLNVGNNTIQQIDRWVHSKGSDYEKLIKTKVAEVGKNKKTKNKMTYNPESLLDKYPYHRFIKNLFN